MYVYLVWPKDYPEDVDLYGVYPTKEQAEAAAKEFQEKDVSRREYYVQEWPVNE